MSLDRRYPNVTYSWIDDQTSAIIVHVALFNPNLNSFEDMWLLMEKSPYGVIYPSYYLGHAQVTTLLDTTIQKLKVVVYVWSIIVQTLSIKRLIKRWRFVDTGMAFTDITHTVAILVAISMYFSMFLNSYRETIVSDTSSLDDLRTYLTSNEQVLMLLENTQRDYLSVELFMLGLTTFQLFYSFVLLSRRSPIGITARTFWGANLIDLLNYYVMFLLGIAMITTFVQPRLRDNVEEFNSGVDGFQRIFSFMMGGLTDADLNQYREDTGYVSDKGRLSITTILVVALIILRLLALPLLRAIVAQNYMKERFTTKYKSSMKLEKHTWKQYFEAIFLNVFSGGNDTHDTKQDQSSKIMRTTLRDVEVNERVKENDLNEKKKMK